MPDLTDRNCDEAIGAAAAILSVRICAAALAEEDRNGGNQPVPAGQEYDIADENMNGTHEEISAADNENDGENVTAGNENGGENAAANGGKWEEATDAPADEAAAKEQETENEWQGMIDSYLSASPVDGC